MQRLRFINPLAQITEVTVAAVNDGLPLVYHETYAVSNEVAKELLKNEGDWQKLSPPREKAAGDETAELPVVAETEVGNE